MKRLIKMAVPVFVWGVVMTGCSDSASSKLTEEQKQAVSVTSSWSFPKIPGIQVVEIENRSTNVNVSGFTLKLKGRVSGTLNYLSEDKRENLPNLMGRSFMKDTDNKLDKNLEESSLFNLDSIVSDLDESLDRISENFKGTFSSEREREKIKIRQEERIEELRIRKEEEQTIRKISGCLAGKTRLEIIGRECPYYEKIRLLLNNEIAESGGVPIDDGEFIVWNFSALEKPSEISSVIHLQLASSGGNIFENLPNSENLDLVMDKPTLKTTLLDVKELPMNRVDDWLNTYKKIRSRAESREKRIQAEEEKQRHLKQALEEEQRDINRAFNVGELYILSDTAGVFVFRMRNESESYDNCLDSFVADFEIVDELKQPVEAGTITLTGLFLKSKEAARFTKDSKASECFVAIASRANENYDKFFDFYRTTCDLAGIARPGFREPVPVMMGRSLGEMKSYILYSSATEAFRNQFGNGIFDISQNLQKYNGTLNLKIRNYKFYVPEELKKKMSADKISVDTP